MEIAGHEFWSHDGKTIWFDLQTPRSEQFWIAGVNIETGRETRYHLERDWWSVHYNVSWDGKLFGGDGGDPTQVAFAPDGQWINLFTPQPDGSVVREKLVNMAKHNYVTGKGSVNLASKTVDLRVEPKLVLTTQGQGGPTDPAGLGVPVVIRGAWAAPQIYPEVAGLLENPAAAFAKLKAMGGSLFGLLEPGGGGASGKRPSPDDMMKQLDQMMRGDGRNRPSSGAPDPRDHPPVAVVHVAFQIMVGCGSWLALVSLIAIFMAWRKKAVPTAKWFLRMVVVSAPLGFTAGAYMSRTRVGSMWKFLTMVSTILSDPGPTSFPPLSASL